MFLLYRKMVFKITLIVLALLISGCKNEATEGETVFRKGIAYKVGSSEPYTGIITGFVTLPGKDTVLTFKRKYVDGIQNGDSTYYYPNGVMERKEPYKNGKINGLATYFYDNGQVKVISHIENGQRGGDYGEAFYHRN